MSSEILTGLDRSLTRTLAAFAADPVALEQRYAPDKWTGRQMLLHIVDCESAFLDRIKRALADSKPLLWALEPDRWDARLVFPNRTLAVGQALFSAQRATIRELAVSITDAEWPRQVVHSEAGKVSVLDIMTKVVFHNEHHLAQVEAAIAGRTWVKAG